MKTMKLFERELSLISDEILREAVALYLEKATPDYFWTDGASASGKYHPKFAHGIGGTVRHTKAAVMFAEELLRMSSYAYMKQEYKDYVIAALLLHDTRKYGYPNFDKSQYADHAHAAAHGFLMFCREYNFDDPHFLLLNAMESHMGQWSTDRENRPFTSVDRCVHMADYMASRSFIDIPAITEEWEAVEHKMMADGELPF